MVDAFRNSNALFYIGLLRRGADHVLPAGRLSDGDLMVFPGLRTIAFASLTAVLSGGSLAAGQVVYPANGQSAEQQKSDEAACHTWAVEQSKYDPANPPPMPAATAQPVQQPAGPTGARARGAVGGAVIGGIADGDVGEAALVGAALGGSRERRERRAAEQQALAKTQQEQAAAQQQRSQGEAAYAKARAACLEGRGYVVR